MSSSFFKRVWQKPPVLFPLVALFHIAVSLYLLWDAIADPVSTLFIVQPVLMLIYTVVWIFVCDMKRWAALAYIGLVALNLVFLFLVPGDGMLKTYFTTSLFPSDVLFTFFVLFYYKRFE